ncbi:cytochrome-c peroxidase [Lentibacter algarum]|nr:cytochrome c peroxidase [Lentibacter algarum]MBU2982465.1 cytochrome-c peroxidase [Lentibacter algarum]
MSLQATLSLAAETLKPVTHSDFPTFSEELVMLGRDLFHDPILSGNRNISCASCHHAWLGSADAVALSVGEGGAGLGTRRHGTPASPAEKHVPRNAPAIFNLGASEFTTLFHDGRVMVDDTAPYGISMPKGFELEREVTNLLAAQALLPVTSFEEMAGQHGENDVADALSKGKVHGPEGAWAILTARVEGIPAYRAQFDTQIGADKPLHITDIGNAIGAFLAFEFRADNSPFDAYLRGDTQALTPAQTRGMELFYGKAECSTCHAGRFQTDHDFHAIGIPQIGPGKGHDSSSTAFADHGRAAITGKPEDKYCFRTPSLRNVALTGPYGHSGAYATLEEVLGHHLDPHASLIGFDPAKAPLPALGGYGQVTPQLPEHAEIERIFAAITLDLPPLTEGEQADIIAFLHSLTDSSSVNGRLGAPLGVPSKLRVDTIAD